MVDRHESLRTSFELIDGEPRQIVHAAVELQVENITCGSSEIKDIAAGFVRPFDLSRAPLFRAGVAKIAANHSILIMDMYHIIADGTSLDILQSEFISLFQGQTLPALKLQYKDFAVWQNALLEKGYSEKQEQYWSFVFSGELPVLNMPTDYPRPSMQSFAGDKLIFAADAQLQEKLLKVIKEICRPHIRLEDIEILTEPEKEMLIAGFNRIAGQYPADKPLKQLFESQAEKTPDNTAIVFKDRQLTYKEGLTTGSTKLAWQLQEKVVKPALSLLERSIEMLVGLLAIIKAGCAYVPLDPG